MKTTLRAAALTVMIFVAAMIFPVGALADNSSMSSISQGVSPKSITINVKDADVRDVLSAVAVNMGYSIVYKGESSDISVKLENVSPSVAFEYILKLIGMTNVREGRTLIVADRDTLTSDFSRSLSLSRFDLKYITPEVLTSKIVQLQLPVTVLSLESNESALWVQGFPVDIAKGGELIGVLDIEENLDEGNMDSEDQEGKTLSYIRLHYLSAFEFNRFLKTLGVENGISISDDDDELWIYANPDERSTILDIRSKIDKSSIDVDINESDTFETLTVVNISKNTAISAIKAVCPELTVISVDNASKAFFVSGERYDIDRADEMISELDRVNNNSISTTFFNYPLEHITSAEASRRLSGVTFGDSVVWYTSTHPEFGESIFIYCNSDYQDQIRELLERIDSERINTVNLSVYVGSTLESAQNCQNYLEAMLGMAADGGKIEGPFDTHTFGAKTILYLHGTNAETVALIEAILDRLDYLPTDEENIDLSWETYLESQPDGVEPTYEGYGMWVYYRLGGSTTSGAAPNL
jgi:type II secretory pathway component GspD/PulD (secretin)